MATQTRLLTIKEYAAWIRLSPRAVRSHIAAGRIRVIRLGARTIRIDPAEQNMVKR